MNRMNKLCAIETKWSSVFFSDTETEPETNAEARGRGNKQCC